MKEKLESIILLTLPIIAAFVYVVCDQFIDNARNAGQAPLYEQFYFFVISTAIFHMFWALTFVLICMDAFENIRLWRILTTFIVIQTILLYGLAVEMSLFMSEYLYYKSTNTPTNNLNYLVTWSAVAMACLWFDFIVFLIITFRHIFWYDEFVPINIEDPSRMERK